MGYTTDFDGAVRIDPPLNASEVTYLRKFAETRRMDREGGPYFVDGTGSFGQGDGPDIVYNHNAPPTGQPGLWCQWVPNNDGDVIKWDGGEKFYNSVEWMQYIIDHFLKPDAETSKIDDKQFQHFTFDHILNGIIEAQGEDPDDRWRLVVEDNSVCEQQGRIVYGDEDVL